jgi:hypothetical protein
MQLAHFELLMAQKEGPPNFLMQHLGGRNPVKEYVGMVGNTKIVLKYNASAKNEF